MCVGGFLPPPGRSIVSPPTFLSLARPKEPRIDLAILPTEAMRLGVSTVYRASIFLVSTSPRLQLACFRLALRLPFSLASWRVCRLQESFNALNERVQHDLRDMEREFQLEKERKQLHVMRGLLRKAFPELEVCGPPGFNVFSAANIMSLIKTGVSH